MVKERPGDEGKGNFYITTVEYPTFTRLNEEDSRTVSLPPGSSTEDGVQYRTEEEEEVQSVGVLGYDCRSGSYDEGRRRSFGGPDPCLCGDR